MHYSLDGKGGELFAALPLFCFYHHAIHQGHFIKMWTCGNLLVQVSLLDLI